MLLLVRKYFIPIPVRRSEKSVALALVECLLEDSHGVRFFSVHELISESRVAVKPINPSLVIHEVVGSEHHRNV